MIEFKNISKEFSGCIANRNVSFRVEKGTLHGLIGENGAGKSTAMKMLFGLYQPTSGEIFVRGQSVKMQSPIHAMKLGIGMVHQHFMLAQTESVLDNVILGHEPGDFRLNRKLARERLQALVKRYGIPFDAWDKQVGQLSVGEQQRVEIIKLLYQESEVLILDEPTAVLTPQEVQDLFQNIKTLQAEGKTIILISHKLKEVLGYTDTITVLRRGETVGTVHTKDTNEEQLAEMMVGRKVSFQYQGERKIAARGQRPQKPVLTVKNLNLKNTSSRVSVLKDVSFDLRPGEILGIGGVQGNGQTELLRFLSHPAAQAMSVKTSNSGEYLLQGSHVDQAGPLDLRRKGLGIVPEDRHEEGLFLQQDMIENFLLGQQQDPRYVSSGLLSGLLSSKIERDRVRTALMAKMKIFDIRPDNPDVLAGKMSGGNQQKLLLARSLDPEPSVCLIAHPTRGVDVGAIELIHEVMMRERNAGRAILLFSSELDELMDLSDRLLVFFEGRIVKEFLRPEFDSWQIGKAMGGIA
jgi:simple sugar transport system ATP-binding protein